MGTVDAATWQALGLVLTLIGLGFSAVLWLRRGAASGLRGVAWSLLPLAAGLTGVLRLGWEVTDAVGRWAANLVFSPIVWLGWGVAAVSGACFVVSGLLRRRRPAKQSLPSGKRAALPQKQSQQGDPELAEIEDLLRRHGIS
jgi:hypothetical protein